MTLHSTPGQPPLRAGDQTQTAAELQEIWDTDPRWDGVERTYTAEDVIRLRGSVREESTLAQRGAENLWNLLHTEDYIRALGAYTGGQAVQQVRAGLKAIYLSGWQVAADGNLAGQTYPDQSLYPANSVPAVVRRINNALIRQDQIEHAEAFSGRRAHAGLAGADRGGCRGRLRRTAQRLRAGAVADLRRRRRHPLGGPARVGEEVRPPRRQGARADAAAHPHAERGAAGGGCRRRADRHHRPHRCPRRRPADERRRRARPGVHHRRAHERGLLPRAPGPGRGHQPRPGLRPLRRPDLGRDRRARHRAGAGVRRRRSTRSTPASCWRTTARRRSTGSATSTTSRSRPSSRSWPTWATSSSSSPWPASTPSTTRCSTSHRATPTAR